MSEILAHGEIAKFITYYGESEIKKAVYSLANSGSLIAGGRTRKASYISTDVGQAAEKIYSKSFDLIKEKWNTETHP